MSPGRAALSGLLAVLLISGPAAALEAEWLEQAAAVARQAQASAARAASCSPLRSGGSSTGTYDYWVLSVACPMASEPPGFAAIVKKHFTRFGATPPTAYTVYAYEYQVSNRGPTEIQMNFSDWKFLYSPFTDIVQGFSVTVPAGQTYMIVYAAISTPKLVLSPGNLGVRGGSGRFDYHGSGQTGLYYPERHTPYLVLKNALVPNR